MWIHQLSVRQFRNLAAIDIEPHRRFNILFGQNAAGKTNLLEAIHVLGSVRSFRPSKNQDLIQMGTDSAEVTASLDKDGLPLSLRLVVDSRRKRFFINQCSVNSYVDYLGALDTVVFSPDDMQLLRGRSSPRRRFLDRMVCATRPVHLADLSSFNATLEERNRLLKYSSPDGQLLDIYTEQLVPLSVRIVSRRLEVIETARTIFSEVFAHIFDARTAVRLSYDQSWTKAEMSSARDETLIEDGIRQAFERNRRAELHGGFTMTGPHRDDISVFIEGLPSATFASQGQMRAIVLALKIAEIRFLEQTNRQCPVLLLDDVSSELDRRRNEQLFEFIRQIEAQTFITTTDLENIRIRRDCLTLEMKSGSVAMVQ